jgi:hypothetical protein
MRKSWPEPFELELRPSPWLLHPTRILLVIATLTLVQELISAWTEHVNIAVLVSVSLIMGLGLVQGVVSIKAAGQMRLSLRVSQEAQFLDGEMPLELLATREYFGMFHALSLSPATVQSGRRRKRLSLIVGPGSASPRDLHQLSRYLSWRRLQGVETA